eukprot:365401-Chlamydomonas_euryale.AAC.9
MPKPPFRHGALPRPPVEEGGWRVDCMANAWPTLVAHAEEFWLEFWQLPDPHLILSARGFAPNPSRTSARWAPPTRPPRPLLRPAAALTSFSRATAERQPADTFSPPV